MLLQSPFLKSFTRHLAYSPPRLWQLLEDDGQVSLQWTSRPQGLWRNASAQWVIDRSQCVFRCLDLSHVPRAQRAQALAVKLSGLSPYRSPGHYAVWREGHLMLWLWDQEVQQSLAASAEELPRHYRCFPESVFQAGVPATDPSCVRLVEVKRGVDLQVWEAGVLLQSIHYPTPPSTSQIGLLARAITGMERQPPSAIVRGGYLAAPWGSGWQSAQSDWERWLPHALLAVLLLGCAMQLTQGAVWWSESQALQTEHAQLAEKVEPLLDARSRAQQANAAVSQLQRRMQAQPSQIELLRKVSPLLPADTKLVSWRLRNSELELLIVTDNQDPRFFVQRLQDNGHFHNVSVEPAPAGNGLRLLMSLSAEGAK